MPTISELQTKLASVRREVRNLTVMGLDPSQPPEQSALIKELERSARAEMRLRTMALAHAKSKLAVEEKRKKASRLTDNMTSHPERAERPRQPALDRQRWQRRCGPHGQQ